MIYVAFRRKSTSLLYRKLLMPVINATRLLVFKILYKHARKKTKGKSRHYGYINHPLNSTPVTLLAQRVQRRIRDNGHLRNLSNFSKIKDAEIKCN